MTNRQSTLALAPPLSGGRFWRLFGLLFLAGLLGVAMYALTLPYLVQNLPPSLTETQAPPSTPLIIAAVLGQYGLILAIAIWGGLTLTHKMDITPLVVVQAVLLNGVALLFGWLYWYRGLEAAIIAHIAVHLGYTSLGLLLF